MPHMPPKALEWSLRKVIFLWVFASLSTASLPKAGISDLRCLGMPVFRDAFSFHVKMGGVPFGISHAGISSHLRMPICFQRTKLPAPQSAPSASPALALLTDWRCLHPLSVCFPVTCIPTLNTSTTQLQMFGIDFI